MGIQIDAEPIRFDSNAFYESLLQEEGIPIYQFPLGVQQTQALTQACQDFFRDPYLADNDPRKSLAYAWMQLDQDPQTRFYYESASLSYYLSEHPSYRRRGTRAMIEPNVRQMARAINNISAYADLQSRYDATEEAFADLPGQGLEIQFTRTDNISPTNLRRFGAPSRELGVQPCPEALYQLRLFENGQYVARVGFNIHKENGQKVVSIVNMQGAREADFATFKENHGVKPVNILLRRLIALSRIPDQPPFLLRGISNSPRGNHAFYNSTFAQEGIMRMHYTPKPRFPNGL